MNRAQGCLGEALPWHCVAVPPVEGDYRGVGCVILDAFSTWEIDMTLNPPLKILAGLAVAGFVAACASAPAPPEAPAAVSAVPDLPAPEWRKIIQQDERFAVFISQPAVREGDLAFFRMVYVYMPDEVSFENRFVAWQEYPYATLDCARDSVRMGQRTRYDFEGSAFGQDEDTAFYPIIGHAVARSRDVICRNEPWDGMDVVAGGAGWVERERAKIPGSKAL